MVSKKDIEDSMGPDGVFYRNPTHLYEGEKAEDQSDIVKAIKGLNKKIIKETLTFEEGTRNLVFPGFKKVRELDKDTLISLCTNLAKYRPNLFKITIVLGEYPKDKTTEMETRDVRDLQLNSPEGQVYLGERLGGILDDKAVSVRFEVLDGAIGNFAAECSAWAVKEEETYLDDEFFKPVVVIEYYSV